MLRMNQPQLCQYLTDVSQFGDWQWKACTLLRGRAYYYYCYYHLYARYLQLYTWIKHRF